MTVAICVTICLFFGGFFLPSEVCRWRKPCLSQLKTKKTMSKLFNNSSDWCCLMPFKRLLFTPSDVIDIGFPLLLLLVQMTPPTPPPLPTHVQKQSQTHRWLLQDLTITRGAFNQSEMPLGGASDGRGGGKELITSSQSLSLSIAPPCPYTRLLLLHLCFSMWSSTSSSTVFLFPLPPRTSYLTISRHAHREHRSTPWFHLGLLHSHPTRCVLLPLTPFSLLHV